MNHGAGSTAPASTLDVTLRHLRAFVTVARLGSFVEAARTLHVTQAALSKLVGELERRVELRLLDRTTRRVQLSEQGRQYITHAERVLDALGDAARCAADLRAHRAGVVRIATTRLVGWSLMPEVIARFRKQHPDAQVVLVDALVSGLLETLETGQADLAISNDASSRPGIESAPLFRSRLHLVCPARHPLARRRHASWDEWRREPLICIGTLPLLQLRRELGPKLELDDIRVVGDVTAALTMVAAGVGLAICPGYVLPATRVHRLRAIPCTDPVVVREYALHRRGVATLSPVAVSFKAFLETHFADGKGRCVEAARPSLLA